MGANQNVSNTNGCVTFYTWTVVILISEWWMNANPLPLCPILLVRTRLGAHIKCALQSNQSEKPNVSHRLEYTDWNGLEHICHVSDVPLDSFIDIKPSTMWIISMSTWSHLTKIVCRWCCILALWLNRFFAMIALLWLWL